MVDTYTYIQTLQRLADLAWPFMDYQVKEEMVRRPVPSWYA